MKDMDRHVYLRLTEEQAGWWTTHLEIELLERAHQVRGEDHGEDKAACASIVANLAALLEILHRAVHQLETVG